MPQGEVIRPAFPGFSMLLASIFIWQYKKIFIKKATIDGGEIYDVFISYSTKQEKWVEDHIYDALKEFKKANKKTLSIFFAKVSIPPGENFHDYYKDAILNSTLFLPIYTKEYFESNHCQEELKFAALRSVETKNTEIKFRVYPLAFDVAIVPLKYKDENIGPIDDENRFMEQLKATLYKS